MNNPERPIPEAGQYYMHFKGKMCLVINIATHSETGEKLVIYMCLGDTESTERAYTPAHLICS